MVAIGKLRLANGETKPVQEVKDLESILTYNYYRDEYKVEKFERPIDNKDSVKLKTYYLLTHTSSDRYQSNVDSSVYLSPDQLIRIKIDSGKYNYTTIKDLDDFLRTFNDYSDKVDVYISIFNYCDRNADMSKMHPVDYIARYTESYSGSKLFFVNKDKTNTFSIHKYENSDAKEFYKLPKVDGYEYIVNGVLL